MPKEKPKLVFIEKDAIPTKGAGRTGFDYALLLAEIPEGKAWQISEDDKEFKLSTVKTAVKAINKKAGKDIYKAVQRTENGKKYLYVSKITE